MPRSKTTPKAKPFADYVTDLFCRILPRFSLSRIPISRDSKSHKSRFFFFALRRTLSNLFLSFYLLFFSPYIFFFLRLVDNSYTIYLLVYQGSTTRACLSRVTYRDFPLPSTHFVNNSRIRYTRTRSLIIGTWPTILRTILLAR